MYAVNVADLTKYKDDIVLFILLDPVLDREQAIDVEYGRRFDGIGARLICDEERAAAIVAVIRMRIKRHELRLYHRNPSSQWKRV